MVSGQKGPAEYVAGVPAIVNVAQVDAEPPLNVQSAMATSPAIAPSAKWSVSKVCCPPAVVTAVVVELEDDELPQPAARTVRQATASATWRSFIGARFSREDGIN